MVTAIVGACGNTNRMAGAASSLSSGTIGAKSLPSAPRPCSQMTAADGFGAVSISIVSSKLVVIVDSSKVYSFATKDTKDTKEKQKNETTIKEKVKKRF